LPDIRLAISAINLSLLVKAVHNDGEKTVIEATEYCYKYSGLDVAHKIINGTKDYTIFPSSPEELNLELDKARRAQVKELEEAKEQITKSERLIAEIDSLISGKLQKSLKAMSYKEMSQAQYTTKMAELAA